MRKRLFSSAETYLKLARPEEFQQFFKGLIEFLQIKLKQVEVDGKESYYICGETHAFKFLWIYTDKKRLDFYPVKDLINEFFFRELECECEILGGHKEVRRREL